MANSGLNVTIEWDGLDEFITLLDNFSPTVEAEIIKKMTRYKFQLEGGTKRLTPVLTNDLTKSITTSDVVRHPGEYFFVIGSDLPYALRMHEHTGGWGERTLAKPPWRGYQPGNKFIENAIRATESDWVRAMESVLDDTIRKGRF